MNPSNPMNSDEPATMPGPQPSAPIDKPPMSCNDIGKRMVAEHMKHHGEGCVDKP